MKNSSKKKKNNWKGINGYLAIVSFIICIGLIGGVEMGYAPIFNMVYAGIAMIATAVFAFAQVWVDAENERRAAVARAKAERIRKSNIQYIHSKSDLRVVK